jgi:hypothetical protein
MSKIRVILYKDKYEFNWEFGQGQDPENYKEKTCH